MKILALILARGGSKRVPGKNIRPLGRKPLILWSIEVARGVRGISDILVSTDDNAIADLAREADALVPWLRPTSLSDDSASSVDAALHALDWYERENGELDGLLLLQPTSPFRSRETMQKGIDLFKTHNRRPVIGVMQAKSHPLWCFKVEGEVVTPFIQGEGLHLRSQDLPPVYAVNGAFYLISPADLRSSRSFFSQGMLPLFMEHPRENIDIDTELDWQYAEAVVEAGYVS